MEDEGEALWGVAERKIWYRPSTMEWIPRFASVWTTLLKASKACAPGPFFEHWDTLRAITAGRSTRSARLFVGSMRGSCPCSLRINQMRHLPIAHLPPHRPLRRLQCLRRG